MEEVKRVETFGETFGVRVPLNKYPWYDWRYFDTRAEAESFAASPESRVEVKSTRSR